MRTRLIAAAEVAAVAVCITTVSALPASADAPSAVEISAMVTSPAFTGVWTASGAIEDAGTFARTDLHFSDSVEHSPKVGTFQVVITFVGSQGTFSLRDQLRFSSAGLTGTWQVASGTGAYAQMSGHGKSDFDFETGTITFTGMLSS